MKKLLIATSALSFFAMTAMAESWSGTISDAHCGAKHTAGAAADAKCVETCVKGGADPVFVSDGKVYKISADSADKVKAHYCHKVTVTDKMEGATVTVESVKM